jgi:hypothetical protein
VCVACGEELVKRAPVRTPKLVSEESGLAALGGGLRVGWVLVFGSSARVHCKPGGRPCLRITYDTDNGRVSEFLALEHVSAGARWHGQRRWRELSRTPGLAPPVSAAEALERVQRGELRRPVRLLVDRSGEWPVVRGTEFAQLERVA